MSTKTNRRPLPATVRSRLHDMGGALRLARLRRRWSQALMAQKAGVAIMTLRNAEQGHTGVALATYARLLWALNLDALLDPLVDPAADRSGLAMEASRLGKRVRTRQELDDDF